MGRFFLVVAGIMLALLLVDSAMNDPDVQPVVDRQFERAAQTIRSLVDRLPLSSIVVAGVSAHALNAKPAVNQASSRSPAGPWYASTMLAMALTVAWLAKSMGANLLGRGRAGGGLAPLPSRRVR